MITKDSINHREQFDNLDKIMYDLMLVHNTISYYQLDSIAEKQYFCSKN